MDQLFFFLTIPPHTSTFLTISLLTIRRTQHLYLFFPIVFYTMSKMERKKEEHISSTPDKEKNPSGYTYLRLPLDDTKLSIWGCSQVIDLQLTPVGLVLIQEQLELWRTAPYYERKGGVYRRINQLLLCCHPLLSRDRRGTMKVQFGSGDLRRDLRFVVSHLPKAAELTIQVLNHLYMILRRKQLAPLAMENILQFVGLPSALSSALLPHISSLCCKPKENISPYLRRVLTETPVHLMEVSLYGNFQGSYTQARPGVQDGAESFGISSTVSISSEPPLKRKKKTVASTSTC